MSEYSEITQIYNTESIERLQKAREDEILKIHKLELLLSILKSATNKDLVDEEQDTLEKRFTILSIQNFIKIGESDHLLSLSNYNNVELSYTERKAVRELVVRKVREICNPIVEYVKEAKENITDVFNPSVVQDKIIQLEEKRRKFQTQLINVKNEKCKLLKTCAEVKLSPYLRNELELIHTDYRCNQAKANVLQSLLIQDLCTRTDHAVKAIKEVQGYINTKLEEE